MRHRTTVIVVVLYALCCISACSSNDRPDSEGDADALGVLQSLAARDAGFGQAMADCLRHAGFTADILEDGSLNSSYPPGRENDYDEAVDGCLKDTGYDQPPPVLSEQTLNYMYDQYLIVRDCLVAANYGTIDTGDRNAFLASQGASWSPYASVVGDLESAVAECPTPW